MSTWILRIVLAASCVFALAASGRASRVPSPRDAASNSALPIDGRDAASDSGGGSDDRGAQREHIDPARENQLG